MSNHSVFNYVNVYHVDAICGSPLHVGSGEGEQGEVLIHPVTGIPFIQASGLAGSFRDFAEKVWGQKISERWFGSSCQQVREGKDDFRSPIVFTDAVFDKNNLDMELRTRVRINGETGTSDAKSVGRVSSGQLLQTEYISKGSRFSFDIYEYYKDMGEYLIVGKVLSALDQGHILFGGQLSNGCGMIRLEDVRMVSCDMYDRDGRKKWSNIQNEPGDSVIKDIRNIQIPESGAYEFYMDVVFDRSVLVKGERYDESSLKMPLMDAHGDFVIPGSSIKGVFRNQIERIAAYKGEGLREELIPALFEDRSKAFFYDVPLNGETALQTRIHIDKFTGGVIDRSLFSEAVTGGDAQIHIRLEKSSGSGSWGQLQERQAAALILLTMRDCAIGAVNVGSGFSVGRGFMKVKGIRVEDVGNDIIYIDVENTEKPFESDVVRTWFSAIAQEGCS